MRADELVGVNGFHCIRHFADHLNVGFDLSDHAHETGAHDGSFVSDQHTPP